ncbi:MAG: hypothetical protein DDT23_00744 [candidate division WS2 bacterium]|nr:hypothetical protein [Candidatus Lithacetigena glycinireducens]
MKTMLAILAILVMLGAFVPTAVFAKDIRVEKPTIVVGQSWTYRNTYGQLSTRTIESVEQDGGFTTRLEGYGGTIGKEVFTSGLNIRIDHGRTFEPYGVRYSFPFGGDAKKEWSGTYTFPHLRTGETVTVKATVKLGEWAQVKVPAGTFDAIEIIRRGDYRLQSGHANYFVERTFWAPAVGSHVKRTFMDYGSRVGPRTFELVRFR